MIDLNAKRARYAHAGTLNFWVVDPLARPAQTQLIAWQRAFAGDDRQIADVRGDEEFTAQRPFPVGIRPASLMSEPAASG